MAPAGVPEARDGYDAGVWPLPAAGPSQSDSAAYWRSLAYFALSRLVVAAVLVAYVPVLRGTGGLQAGFDVPVFLPVAIVYLIVSVVLVFVSRSGRVRFRTLAALQVAIDVAALSVLIHAAGGLRSGLAILLILPNAGAAILLGTRLALFFAASSALLLLAETAWRLLRDDVNEAVLVQAGLVGAALLAGVLVVCRLAARLEAQERLAWRRGEDLRNQLAVTQAVIGAVHDGVVVLGERGEPRAINRSAREMLGGSEADGALPGLPPLRAALGLPSPADPSRSAPSAVGGEAVAFGVPDGPGGAERRLRARMLAMPGGPADAVVLLEDLGRLEERAQQLKLASMGRLSASIAHEVRNPLAAIRHANGLLAERLADRQLQRLATIVEDNCQRINRVIEDVLSISRRGSATPEPLPAAAFLARTIDEYVAQSGADPRRITCRVALDAPIWFDAGNLRQVLLNLLGNALRHAGARPDAVRVEWASDASGRPVLTVADDGPGVPPALRVHLFEPFFTTEARGTGLGLHLARELCTANGATIRYRPASDNPAQRSAFVVEPLLSPPGRVR